jgi:hypothetical protein
MVRILSVSVALTMGAGAGGAAASHASAMTVPASGAGTDDQRHQGEGNALMDVGDAHQAAGAHAAAARAYGKAFAAFAQRSKSDAKETQAVSLAVDEFKLAQDADPKNLALLEEEAKLLERFMAHPKRKGALPEGLEEELARVRTRIGELKGKEAERKEAERKEAERKEAERKEAAAKAAVADEPATEVGPSVDEDAQMPPVAEKPSWIRRWAPTRNVVEVALVVGVYVPGKNHELYEATFDLPDQGFRTYKPGPELGVRASYLPLRFLAIELEGMAIPTRTSNDAEATIWTVRSGLLAQLPHWTVAPFAIVGGGALGVVSERSAVGNDVDFGMYFGGGLKTHFGRRIQVRWDIRDVVSYKRGEANSFGNHNFESLLALVVMFDVAAVRP